MEIGFPHESFIVLVSRRWLPCLTHNVHHITLNDNFRRNGPLRYIVDSINFKIGFRCGCD